MNFVVFVMEAQTLALVHEVYDDDFDSFTLFFLLNADLQLYCYRSITLFNQFLSSIRRGSSKEASLASRAISKF